MLLFRVHTQNSFHCISKLQFSRIIAFATKTSFVKRNHIANLIFNSSPFYVVIQNLGLQKQLHDLQSQITSLSEQQVSTVLHQTSAKYSAGLTSLHFCQTIDFPQLPCLFFYFTLMQKLNYCFSLAKRK